MSIYKTGLEMEQTTTSSKFEPIILGLMVKEQLKEEKLELSKEVKVEEKLRLGTKQTSSLFK